MTDTTALAAPQEGKPFPFNNQQLAAIKDMVSWFENIMRIVRYNRANQIYDALEPYILQGFAGTGKTTLVKQLLTDLKIPLSRIALIAPTNRAAKVLGNKTGIPTRTMFSLIYSSEREELEYQRVRLRIWNEAANFSMLGDLLIADQQDGLDEEFEDEWESGHWEGYDKAVAKAEFMSDRQEIVLRLEDITLPEDPEARLDLFVSMKKERIKTHEKNIKEILRQDMPMHKRSPEELLKKYDAILCDESSMLSEKNGNDLVSYGVPVFLVGDPFQLPPVKARAYWDGKTPNSLLTKIERQKGPGAGIPLAGEELRNGRIPRSNESLTIHPRQGKMSLPKEVFMAADQILVRTHTVRERIVESMRKWLGFYGPGPMKGEKIVAAYNDKGIGIMNGELYEVLEARYERGDTVVEMDLKDPFGKVIPSVKAWVKGFGGRSQTDKLDEAFGKFWFGYAITCHQSQGSEWPVVIVYDDGPGPSGKLEYYRWLYTAITRASRKCEWIR